MSLTRIGVVSTDTVAVCVPAAVVSTSAPEFFLPHAADALEKTSVLTRAANRVLVVMASSGVWDSELQSGMNQIRIGNLVCVGGVDLLPLPRVAVNLFGDFAEAVAFLDGVSRTADRRSRRAAGS